MFRSPAREVLPGFKALPGDVRMTAAEILRSAEPPSDDGVIEKAIAELDVKIWEWTDALKSAQAQLRSAFAVRPVPVPRPQPAPMFDEAVAGSLSAAAAAAHIPTPPLPQWTPPPPPTDIPAWSPSPQSTPALSGHTSAFQQTPSASPPNQWPQPSAPQQGGHGMGSEGASDQPMQWPSATTVSWPDASGSSSSGGTQQWPTWTPTDLSQSSASSPKKSSVRATKAPKAVRPPVQQGPTPEERAQKAAAEEAMLAQLEDAIARRVRLLRRLDPDTPIEKLIEKAKQGAAETSSSATAKDDKSSSSASSSSSWWRRK